VFERYQPDLGAYVRRVRTGPCFVCAILAQDPASLDHHIIDEDEDAIVFLAMNPTQYGYTLVAPKEHKEQVAGDFTVEEYLGLQRVVHRVAKAVREEVGAERVYVLSLGSNRVTPTSTGTLCPCLQASLMRSSSSWPSCSRPRAR
jgi:galactose-1-phosphate uridylyltransferase